MNGFNEVDGVAGSMLWLDQKYIGIISVKLDGFKKSTHNAYNFRCPVCGDSQHKRKKRGYLYYKKGNYNFFCHNCSASMSLWNFLKYLDPVTHSQYVLEHIREHKDFLPKTEVQQFADKMKQPEYVKDSPLKTLYKISSLGINHPAKKYIAERLIPNFYHSQLYWVEGFKTWVNKFNPGKFEHPNENNDNRIIIPLVDDNDCLMGLQGRSIDEKNSIRYISIMLGEEGHKIFNLNNIDKTKTIYVVEGPFDAMFLGNAIATCQGHIQGPLAHLTDIDKSKFVLVFDNEPRSKQLTGYIEKAINQGYKVCLWPKTIKEKDINKMVLGGLLPEQVKDIIDRHTFSGMRAMLELQSWRK